MMKRHVLKLFHYAERSPSSRQDRLFSKSNSLVLRKALLLKKLSRLEIERFRHPDLSEEGLKQSIINRGSDYNAMVKHHEINREFQSQVYRAFKTAGVEIRAVNRFNYNESSIDWCDAVFPIGGDGTFLLAANKISDSVKPVIGLNSDPLRSEGHLCLPKQYSTNIALALNKLLTGKFRWMFRSRIRVTVTGGNINDTPVELHEQALRFKIRDLGAEERRKPEAPERKQRALRVLPVLALNEVFLGESLSAKVSYFEVKVNGSEEVTRVKSSGLLICTGTGSTSWHLSMNRSNKDDVRHLLQLYASHMMSNPPTIPLLHASHKGIDIDETLIAKVCDQFNNRFVFSPEDSKLGYTLRDLICAGVWPKPKGRLPARGFANRMEVKSRCSDAGLVIDGGISFPFNDGTVAILESRREDALRTVALDE